MNKFYSSILVFFLLLSCKAGAQLVTIGTGTSYNGIYNWPAPYGNYDWGAKHQMLIRASELNAAGITGARMVTSLALNVRTIRTATGGVQPLSGLTISMKNVPYSAFPTSGFSFEPGTIQVFTTPLYSETTGWNTHTFQSNFYWDGVSNVVVDICFNNNSFSNNAATYYSSTPFQSVLRYSADINSVCTAPAIQTMNLRPNMRLNFIAPQPVDANFTGMDTVFRNTPYTFKNTSANHTKSYWKVYGLPSNLCNSYGCFYDTTNNDLKLTFTQLGTYFIKLVTPGYTGYDSIIKSVYVTTYQQKPKANFYASATNVFAPNTVSFFDSSLYGAYAWDWFLVPYCYGCATNPGQIPNYFDPSASVQNPLLNIFDGGTFDVCLAVRNDKGSDTICKKNYLKVTQGFSMCNGADSLSTLSTGFVFDPGGPLQNYQAQLTGQCKTGFVIDPGPCTDSIILNIQQFRLRLYDTLEIRDGGTSTSPLIKKLVGSNLPAANKVHYAKSGKAFLRLYTYITTSPPGDSGFVIKWSTVSAGHLYASKANQCPGDSVILKVNTKPGRSYQWLYNDFPVGGPNDSVLIAKQIGNYKAIVSGPGCSDSSEITLSALPKVATGFRVNAPNQCFFSNNFIFTDTSEFSGAYTRSWSFGDNTSSTLASPQKKYAVSGTFKVRLTTTTTGSNCRDSAILYVQNLPSPGAKITIIGPTADPCDNDSVQFSTIIGSGYSYQWFYNSLEQPGDTLPNIWVKHPGSYQVKIMTNSGCDSLSVPVASQLRPSPVPPVIIQDSFVLRSTAADNYQWLLENNPITSATQQDYTPTAPGNYRVRTDSTNGCHAMSNVIMMTSTLGIDEATDADRFYLYPNPASSDITVGYTRPFTWNITDMTGRVILNNAVKNSIQHIDLGKLSSGIYLIRISSGNESFIRRIEKL